MRPALRERRFPGGADVIPRTPCPRPVPGGGVPDRHPGARSLGSASLRARRRRTTYRRMQTSVHATPAAIAGQMELGSEPPPPIHTRNHPATARYGRRHSPSSQTIGTANGGRGSKRKTGTGRAAGPSGSGAAGAANSSWPSGARSSGSWGGRRFTRRAYTERGRSDPAGGVGAAPETEPHCLRKGVSGSVAPSAGRAPIRGWKHAPSTLRSPGVSNADRRLFREDSAFPPATLSRSACHERLRWPCPHLRLASSRATRDRRLASSVRTDEPWPST